MFKASEVLQGDFLRSQPTEFLHKVSANYAVDEDSYLRELIELAQDQDRPELLWQLVHDGARGLGDLGGLERRGRMLAVVVGAVEHLRVFDEAQAARRRARQVVGGGVE